MSSLLRLLGLAPAASAAPSAGDTESVRKIVEALDRLEPERARYLAAFAYLLSRVAYADLKISPEEIRTMELLVAEKGAVSEAEAILVVQVAKTQSRLFGGTENFLVSRELNQIASHAQKLQLLECLFAVSASDENVSVAEDNEIRKISNELRLEHADFIAARAAHRQHLGVRKLPDPD